MQLNHRHNKNQPFLIAVTLISLAIAGIILFYYFQDQFYGRVCQDNLKVLAGGLERYVAKNNRFPIDIEELSRGYGVPARAFHCPCDFKKKVSYGINAAVINKAPADVGPNTMVIADSMMPIFMSYKDFDYRHKNGGQRYAYVILKDKTITSYNEPAEQKTGALSGSKSVFHQGCWDEYNQKLNRCRALKMDDSFFPQCPNDALNQYNQCISQ